MTMMMQDKKKALGRGLESLIPAARTAAAVAPVQTGEVVHEIALGEIEPSPYQPRRRKDDKGLEELAASIQVSGVMQPIIVRPLSGAAAGKNGVATAGDGDGQAAVKYQLIAGERRWLASKLAGKETVPAIVRAVSNEHAVELALIENLQREDLNPMEMAHAFGRLSSEFGLTQEQIAKRTAKDRATIGNYMRLLKLPSSIQAAIEDGYLTFGHAKALLALENFETMGRVAVEVLERGLSVRETEELVKRCLWDAPPAERPTRKTAPRPVDPNVREAERQLEQSLGTRVHILDRKGKGKVVIEYSSLEDFDRIVEALSK